MRTLFFDAGNTLCHVNMQTVASIVGGDAETLRAAELRARRALDVPEHFNGSDDADRWATYFGLILREAGIDAPLGPLREHHDRHNLWDELRPDVVPALERLAALGVRLAVVSNSDGTVERKLEQVGIRRFFGAVIDSRRVGVEKPDPRIFEIALARTGARRETTAHVGDLYHVDVVGARAAGITPILLDPAGVWAEAGVARIRTLEDLVSLVEARRSNHGATAGTEAAEQTPI